MLYKSHSWKLKSAEIALEQWRNNWSNGNDKEEPHKDPPNNPWEHYHQNEQQLEAVQGSVTILGRALGTKL